MNDKTMKGTQGMKILIQALAIAMTLCALAPAKARADEYQPYLQITCIPELSFFSAKFLYLHSENTSPEPLNKISASKTIIADKTNITWLGTPGPGFSYTCKLAHYYPDPKYPNARPITAPNWEGNGVAEVTLSFGEIKERGDACANDVSLVSERRINLAFNKSNLLSLYKSFDCNYRGLTGDFDDFEVNYRGNVNGLISICDNSIYLGRPCVIKKVEDLAESPLDDASYAKEKDRMQREGVEILPLQKSEYDRIRALVFGKKIRG